MWGLGFGVWGVASENCQPTRVTLVIVKHLLGNFRCQILKENEFSGISSA